jgi:predicted nucleic acid-binding protein
MPAHAVIAPDVALLEEAGLIAGIISRRHGLDLDQRRRLLNDALLALTAAANGLMLLTRNQADMDLIGEITGTAAMLFFRLE